MGPERKGQKVLYTVPEAAEVLGVTRQAVYSAISAGQLRTTDDAYGKKIPVEDVLGYGIRVGKDPEELVNRIQKQTGADFGDLVMWVLLGLGLYFLIKGLFGKQGD